MLFLGIGFFVISVMAITVISFVITMLSFALGFINQDAVPGIWILSWIIVFIICMTIL